MYVLCMYLCMYACVYVCKDTQWIWTLLHLWFQACAGGLGMCPHRWTPATVFKVHLFPRNIIIKNMILLLIHFALLLFSLDYLCVQSMLIHFYYLSFNELGYNGPRVAFQASYYSQLEGFLLSHAKIKLPPASMAYPHNSACIPPPLSLCSEPGRGRIPNCVPHLFLHNAVDKGESAASWGAPQTRNRLWRCSADALSLILCPILQHGFCMHRYFGVYFLVSPKWSCACFSLVLVSWFWTFSRIGRGEWWVYMVTSVLAIGKLHRWESFLTRGLHRVAQLQLKDKRPTGRNTLSQKQEAPLRGWCIQSNQESKRGKGNQN